MPLKVPAKGSPSGSASKSATSAGAYLGKLTNLMEFLSSLSEPGGGRREPGILQVTSKGGRWQCKLKCPNGKVYCFVVTDELDEALEVANMGLESGELDWRPDTWEGQSRKK